MTALTYIVHSVARDTVAIKATVGGREVDATVPGLTVELTGEAHGHDHGHTFRFVPDSDGEMAAAEAMFVAGSSIVVTFAPAA